VRSSLVLFGTGLFFLGLSVSSGIVPLPDLMAESRVYGASIGFAIVLAALFDLLVGRCRTAPVRQGVIAVAVMVVAAYGTAAWARNEVWRSASTLWQDAVSKSPGKDRPWHNLGMAYLGEDRIEDAIGCFSRALTLNPAYVRSHEALVVAYTKAGRMAEAHTAAIAGLNVAPRNAVLYNNLGVVFAETGRPEEARQMFEQALQLKPGYESAKSNLERTGAGQLK
jgi:tetratricopeptide (TPR) repeat protein